MLAEPLADDENFRQRFDKEIEALRQLRHPNIVRLLGYGQEGEYYYYVMELVEGHSLEEEIRSGRRFSWRETLALAIQVASALNCAHNHGIIHRDLKPANLLLSMQGAVKLSDFGIATLFGSSKITSVGSIVGTLNYMAPEQAAAQPVTTRSDLFSFGAVLTALLTGRPPFTGSTLPEILHQHAASRARRPSQLGVEIPVEFDELIGRLLEREPNRRPKNAYFVLRMLEAMQEEMTDSTEMTGIAETGTGSIVVPLSTDVLQKRIQERRAEADAEPETVPSNALGEEEPLSLELGEESGADDGGASQISQADAEVNEARQLSLELTSSSHAVGEEAENSGWFESFENSSQNAKKASSNPEGESASGRHEELVNGDPADSDSAAASVADSAADSAAANPEAAAGAEVRANSFSEAVTEISAVTENYAASTESETASSSGTHSDSHSFFLEEKEELKRTFEAESPWGAILMVLVLSAVSIFFISHLIRYWFTPPAADVLYARISQASEDENQVTSERFRENVELFLTCYSTDSRARKVMEFQSEIDLARLERQLLLNSRGPNFRSVPSIERDYLAAIRNLQSEPEKTLEKLEDFIVFYESVCDTLKKKPNFSRKELMKNVRYLEVAKRQVFRIRRVLEEERTERQQILRDQVVNAQQMLPSKDPDEAEAGRKLRKAILDLYQNREPEIVAPILSEPDEKKAPEADVSHASGAASDAVSDGNVKSSFPPAE